MGLQKRFVLALVVAICCSLRSIDGDGIKLPDQVRIPSQQQQQHQPISFQQPQQQQQQQSQVPSSQQQPQILLNNNIPPTDAEGRRSGKNLLDFVGLGTGANVDPYVARVNNNCLGGELADCFKSQALGTFTEFFDKQEYFLSPNVRISRVPEQQFRSLEQEPYEYSSEPHAEEPEWDQLVKFALRKAEKFMKSAIIEVDIPNEITEGGRYSPRFIGDDIAEEIDVIQDKHAPLFKKNKLKKLFIPLLIILKLFKLKLLLFLPLILGLATFKKLLGFAAIIIPGVIGYFKLCRPQQQQHGSFGGSNFFSNSFPQYSSQGLGAASYPQQEYHTHYENHNGGYRADPGFAKPYGEYYGKNADDGNVRFGEDPQDLAYQGQYRNKKGE